MLRPLEIVGDVGSKQLKRGNSVYCCPTEYQLPWWILGDGTNHHLFGLLPVDVHAIMCGLLHKLVNKCLHFTDVACAQNFRECPIVNELVRQAGRLWTVYQDYERQRSEEGTLRHPGNHLEPFRQNVADLDSLASFHKERVHPPDDGIRQTKCQQFLHLSAVVNMIKHRAHA